MENREKTLVEIKARIVAIVDDHNLKTVKRVPTSPITEKAIPAVLFLEGNDDIIKKGSSRWNSYPKVRQMQVIAEVWTKTGEVDVKTLYTVVRNAIFATPYEGVELVETGSYGPFNNGVPGVLGMQLIMALTYIDVGPTL